MSFVEFYFLTKSDGGNAADAYFAAPSVFLVFAALFLQQRIKRFAPEIASLKLICIHVINFFLTGFIWLAFAVLQTKSKSAVKDSVEYEKYLFYG